MTKEQTAKIVNGKIVTDGDSGDRKRTFLVCNKNDGWEDLRIEIDTDDCDYDYAKAWAKRIMDCINACIGVEDLIAINRSLAGFKETVELQREEITELRRQLAAAELEKLP